MKKFIAMLLSLVMMLSLSVPAFAAEPDKITSTEDGSNTASQNVIASYTPGSTTPTEVSLNVKLNPVDNTGAAISDMVEASLNDCALVNQDPEDYPTFNVIMTGDYTMT